jgi:CubicO group peptidase (beta-lactamase class C family)
VLLGLIVVLWGCSKSPGERWPTDRWATSTPEEEGMDSTLLVEMLREMHREDIPLHSVMVARHGRVVLEAYFEPFHEQDRHIIYSATKSITAMLTGIAIADGLVTGDTQSVLEFFPGHRDRLEDFDDGEDHLELRHLLTMTAGFDWQDGPYGVRESGDFSRLLAASDGIAYILNKEILDKPGNRYNYNSGASHLLAAIIQEAAGQTALEYANAKLFGPIGVRNAAWSEYQGINNGGSELFLRPRDMARLGYLVLRRGRWDGIQVVPEEWIDRMTQPLLKTEFEQMGEEYGYGWYTKHIDGRTVWSAEGLGGNGIYVLPELDMVVVFSGGLMGLEMLAPYRYLERYILPAVRSTGSLPADREPARSLEEMQAAADAPEAGSAAALPAVAEAVSGRAFEIADRHNLLGIETLYFDFPRPDLGRMGIVYSGTGRDADWGVDVVYRTDDLADRQRRIELELGLGGRPRTTRIVHDEIGEIPISARGRWEGGCRLLMTVVTGWAIPQTWTIDFCEENSVSLTIESVFYSTTTSGRSATRSTATAPAVELANKVEATP